LSVNVRKSVKEFNRSLSKTSWRSKIKISLNSRIIISATLVLLVFITLTAATLERAFFESTETALKDKMESQLYLLMAESEIDSEGLPIVSASAMDSSLNMPESGLYAFVIDDNNQILWSSNSTLSVILPEPGSIQTGKKIFSRFKKGTETFYSFSHGVNWDTDNESINLTFTIINDLKPFNKQINRYRKTLLSWLVAMAVFLLITQAFILRWGLSPLRKVGKELNKIENGQQDCVEGVYPLELKQLTDNINNLLVQERQQKTRYRNALGDLAHSLKTPLAVIQNLVNDKNISDPALSEQLLQMNNIVEYQLQRAATAGSSQTGLAIPLKDTVEKILASLEKIYRDKKIQCLISIEENLVFKGDEGDLMELLGNVLDNAFKWAQQKVEISATQTEKLLEIIIKDDGPGMDEDQIENLLQRGIRADQTISGHGIGLSIVTNIVDAYDGTIQIGRSYHGGVSIKIKF